MTYDEAETEATRLARLTGQRVNIVTRNGNYMVTPGVPAGWRLSHGVEPDKGGK